MIGQLRMSDHTEILRAGFLEKLRASGNGPHFLTKGALSKQRNEFDSSDREFPIAEMGQNLRLRKSRGLSICLLTDPTHY
jgi:hypothetical protein